MPPTALTFRPITATDADIVAALHAASWRSAYRGILSDAYLTGDVLCERQLAWRQRLATRDDAQFGLLANLGGAPVGFVYLVNESHPEFGTLLDNLHVVTEARSAGIGPQLMAAAADGIIARAWDARVHLWVWDANARARAFYARMGGREVETRTKLAPDGTEAPTWRVAWDGARAFHAPR